MLGAPPPIWVRWTDLDALAWDALLRSKSRTDPAAAARPAAAAPGRATADRGGLAGDRWAQLRREDRPHLVEFLTRDPLPWAGDEGYRTAEVTGGGVP